MHAIFLPAAVSIDEGTDTRNVSDAAWFIVATLFDFWPPKYKAPEGTIQDRI